MSTAAQAIRVGVNPIVQLCHTFNSNVIKYPFISGVIISGLKTSAADLFAQKVVEKKENIDWQRFGLFTAFGYVYLGGFQYLLYSKLIGRAAQPFLNLTGGKYQVPILTALDQFVYHPFMYLPSFYLFKGVAMQQSISSVYEKFTQEFQSNCKALWAVWLPAQIINFKYVPMHYRVPYVALISFVWTVILSQMRGQCEEIKQEEQLLAEVPQGNTQEELTEPLVQGSRHFSMDQYSLKKKQIEAEQKFEGDQIDKQAQINKWVQDKLFGDYIKENMGSMQLNMVSVSESKVADSQGEQK